MGEFTNIPVSPEVKEEFDRLFYSLVLKKKIRSRGQLVIKLIKFYKNRDERG